MSVVLSVYCEGGISSYKLIPANLARGEATSTHVDTNVTKLSGECLQNKTILYLGRYFSSLDVRKDFLITT